MVDLLDFDEATFHCLDYVGEVVLVLDEPWALPSLHVFHESCIQDSLGVRMPVAENTFVLVERNIFLDFAELAQLKLGKVFVTM